MTQALKYLSVELNTPSSDRSSLAKYRAATIHHRLASLLHNTFRNQVGSTCSSNFLDIVYVFRIIPRVGNVYEP